MKLIYLILSLNLWCTYVQSQCKYDVDKSDDFSGEQILKTKTVKVFQTAFVKEPDFYWAFEKRTKDNDTAFFISSFCMKACETSAYDNLGMSFNKGQKMMLKLENDSIITLSGQFEMVCYYKVAGLFTFLSSGWYLDNEYHLSKRDIELLSTYSVARARIYYIDLEKKSESFVDYSYESVKYGIFHADIKKIASCIK